MDLRKLFEYNPDTGIVTHKATRNRNTFTTEGSYKSFLKRFAGKEAGGKDTGGYLRGSVTYAGETKKFMMHRVALLVHGITIPDGCEVDHIDGNRVNNKLSNLRVVTHAENARNMGIGSHNKSGVVGVTWNVRASRWESRITFNGKFLFLGLFADKDKAIAARKAANVVYGYHENHGERPSYNVVESNNEMVIAAE